MMETGLFDLKVKTTPYVVSSTTALKSNGNIFSAFNDRQPPHGLYLGNFSLSKPRTFNPFKASSYAAVAPPGPRPDTMTSYSIVSYQLSVTSYQLMFFTVYCSLITVHWFLLQLLFYTEFHKISPKTSMNNRRSLPA